MYVALMILDLKNEQKIDIVAPEMSINTKIKRVALLSTKQKTSYHLFDYENLKIDAVPWRHGESMRATRITYFLSDIRR